MSLLTDFIATKSPKMNKEVVEGFSYHRVKRAVKYIDEFIRYSIYTKTHTHLRYLGYKVYRPEEELKEVYGARKTIKEYDIAKNTFQLVKFYFQYGDEPEVREYRLRIPYLEKGNIMTISNVNYVVMPTISDKVISIGDKGIFINIVTAKYTFSRSYHPIMVDNNFYRIPIITTKLYTSKSKSHEKTTNASVLVMHYILAKYGYTKTMEMLLGYVPTPVYDYEGDDKIVIAPTGNKPKGHLGLREEYVPTKIKFLVDKDVDIEKVKSYLGNVLYIIENFPDRVTSISDLDDTSTWKLLLGEIIHSAGYTVNYLMNKINTHFNDLNSDFDKVTISKLRDLGIPSTNLIELLVVIFTNYTTWIMSGNGRDVFTTKSLEVETFVLSRITHPITRVILDINKEEIRNNGNMLEPKDVTNVFKSHLRERMAYDLRRDSQYVMSVEYPGDHLYFKKTALVNEQEPDFKGNDTNTSERKKISASMAILGNILGLPKSNPTPLQRLNPYVNVDFNTGGLIISPEYKQLLDSTDKELEAVDATEMPTIPVIDNDDEEQGE